MVVAGSNGPPSGRQMSTWGGWQEGEKSGHRTNGRESERRMKSEGLANGEKKKRREGKKKGKNGRGTREREEDLTS